MDISTQIPTHILNHLINDDKFCRRVIPYLKSDYFEGEHRIVFDLIVNFVNKHNKLPSGKVLEIELTRVSAPEDTMQRSAVLITELAEKSDLETEYIINESEAWCKERAVYGAIMDSIQIINGEDKERAEGVIPDILSEALGVNFDHNIGHDYIDNSEDRFEYYNRKEERIPFDLEIFNKITKNGLPKKTLNIALAGTGVGKSLFMCHCAAANMSDGHNVLYITMEMAEERIAERIDANLMNFPIEQIDSLPKKIFESKIAKIGKSHTGKLIVKEYPTGAAHAGHFRALLNELKLKKNFVPEIIYIDYLNICASARMKSMGGSINSYTYIKAIAEELRGLAIEFNVPIMSATQTTRSGFSNSDVGLEDTSESFGLPATADFMFALISTEELEELGQIMIKQLKNRYNDPTKYRRFVVGVDRSRMKLFDVEETAQEDLIADLVTDDADDKPINTFGTGERQDYSDFKV